jgi:chromate transporter
VVGGLVTAWATFVPSFLWIFLGAPSIERLRGNRRLSAALSAITAAVVGVIANLAVVFAIGVLFDERTTVRIAWHDVVVPRLGSLDPVATAVAVAGYVAIARFRVGVVWVVAASGLIGLARWALT